MKNYEYGCRPAVRRNHRRGLPGPSICTAMVRAWPRQRRYIQRRIPLPEGPMDTYGIAVAEFSGFVSAAAPRGRCTHAPMRLRTDPVI